MKSTNWKLLALPAFLACAISASSCATDRKRIAAAEAEKAVTEDVIAEAIDLGKQSSPLPAAPPQCSGPVRSGVSPDDRVDAALLRQDAAIGRANATLAACAAFYEGVRNGTAR